MADQKFNYGGQAVIEGVMMRGSKGYAIAVRNPEGEIVIKEEPITSAIYNGFWSKVPFIRGLGLLWDSFGLGMKALTYSADVAMGEEDSFSGPAAAGTVVVSLLMSVALFFLLPAGLAAGIHALFGELPTLVDNIIEGLIRLAIVLAYIWGVGRMADIARVFQYHGAEHKTINAYEAGAELTPESVGTFPLEHPRCGTGFLLVIVVISVIIFAMLGDMNIWLRFLTRILFVPLIAGIAYEYIKFTARRLENPLIAALVKPQLWLQKLTTNEPTPEMLAVSIAALERVLEAEQIGKTEALPAAAD